MIITNMPTSGGGANLTENLILNSGAEYSNGNYNIAIYDLSEPFELNTVYTVTIWGDLADTKTAFQAYFGDKSSDYLPRQNEIADGVYSATGSLDTFRVSNDDKTKCLVYVHPNNTGGTSSTIHRIKLERGENHSPVWTPAPQDITNIYKGLAKFEAELKAETTA